MSAETAEWKKRSGKIPYKIFSYFQEITSNSKENTTSDIKVKIYGIPLFAKF
jgi:DNA gyrase inhibitor GyrI